MRICASRDLKLPSNPDSMHAAEASARFVLVTPCIHLMWHATWVVWIGGPPPPLLQGSCSPSHPLQSTPTKRRPLAAPVGCDQLLLIPAGTNVHPWHHCKTPTLGQAAAAQSRAHNVGVTLLDEEQTPSTHSLQGGDTCYPPSQHSGAFISEMVANKS